MSFKEFQKVNKCLTYKFDSPSNCETKEKAEINSCTKYQFFCESDFKTIPVKVRSKTYRFEAEEICKGEKSALATTSEPEFFENIDKIWWEGSIWEKYID